MSIPDFHVYGVVDGKGEIVQTVCDDPSDTICLDGRYDTGKVWHFESDAYHLANFAREKGFEFFHYGCMFSEIAKYVGPGSQEPKPLAPGNDIVDRLRLAHNDLETRHKIAVQSISGLRNDLVDLERRVQDMWLTQGKS